MKELIRKNLWFIIPFVIIWVLAVIAQLLIDKGTLHLALNGCHTPFLDFFFRYYTEVGGWIPAAMIGVLLLFVTVKSGTLLAVNLGVATLITTILKQIFRMPRPKLYFENWESVLQTVDGVRLHSTLSFPSGHTTACFALFFTLALLTKRPWLKVLCFIAACLGAYSRIYLSQHFLEDVIAGSLIATVCVVCLSPMILKGNFGNHSAIGYLRISASSRH